MQRRTLIPFLPLLYLSCILVAFASCISFSPPLLPINGKLVKPEFPLLKSKKVAIFCGDEQGLSNEATLVLLARYLEDRLSRNVKGIHIVPQENVQAWLNETGREVPDCEALGKGVGADYVVAIKLANMSLNNGKSLFKGKADISVAVYDIHDGKIAFRKNMPEFEFPKMDGPSLVDTTEAKFRVSFLTIVSQHIGVLFYPHDPNELAVQDPISTRL